jgi:phosphosulfolactate synthase
MRDAFMVAPSFLHLAERPDPPRSVGLTHVIDGGIGLDATADILRSTGRLIDIWKFGWGTAYLDPMLADKQRLLREHGIASCTGGTLLEVAWLQNATTAFFEWAADVGFPYVEVSNGASAMPLPAKRRLITEATERFIVLSEVGSKDPEAPVSASSWADEAAGDLNAGAHLVLAEGRESGTVGLYDASGRGRNDVADALVRAVGADRLVFEAPTKAQQTWLVQRLGTNVNLGNVAVNGVLGVEALRLGLRADTIDVLDADVLSHGVPK